MAWPMKRIELTFLMLHIAVAGAEIAHDGAELGEIGLGLIGGAEVRLRHDLHQRDARAIQIHIREFWMLVVQALTRVLLKMQPLDADDDPLAAEQIDNDLAFANHRTLVLGDLIALRQVGVEIVLTVEHR
jgi:hypothetical protein